jgi:uncharacterized protein (DUF305 family)
MRRLHCNFASYLAVASLALAAVTGALAGEPVMSGHNHGHNAEAAPQSYVATSAKPYGALVDDAMHIMNDGMTRAPMTGDSDHDFAAMMIPHHQGAVDMAKAELLYGSNPVLRRLAQEIIVTQGQEIQVMQLELNKSPAIPATKP